MDFIMTNKHNPPISVSGRLTTVFISFCLTETRSKGGGRQKVSELWKTKLKIEGTNPLTHEVEISNTRGGDIKYT
jgi:hypothetical protein